MRQPLPGQPQPSRTGRRVLIGLTVLSWFPAVAVLAAGGIAALLGCELDEGSAHACTVVGVDIGEWLYAGFVFGWLLLITLPLMFATAVAWVVVWFRAWWARRRDAA